MKDLVKKVLNVQMNVRFFGYQLTLNWSMLRYLVDKLDAPQADGRLLINVGAGDFTHPNWINVDKIHHFYEQQQEANTINYDLFDMDPMPFESGSVDLIYTSHVIEYVSNDSVDNFLK